MGWTSSLLLIFGCLIFLMASGMPVAFTFAVIDVAGVYLLWGGEAGLLELARSILNSITTFTLFPLPMFVLMGEVMMESGVSVRMIDALDKWFGRMPGRLSLIAVGGGTVFATLSGSSMASVAMLGGSLVPEMQRRGYSKEMSLGPILGSGGLAIMIPPSALAILLGALSEVSIGKLLLGIIIPGLLMSFTYVIYIVVRCYLRPSIAPPYEVGIIRLSTKLWLFIRDVLPLGLILFLVVGLMILGICTPTEAAASGTFGCFFIAACYGKLSMRLVKASVGRCTEISAMILLIMTGATAFSQILAFTGAVRGLAEFAVSLPLSPVVIVILMQAVLLFLGMFMDVIAMMMITVPIFMPVVNSLGLDLIWFAVLFLLSVEIGATSPPFGLNLFVMKSVSGPSTTMTDCYRAGLPFLGCNLVVMAMLFVWPSIALWLPRFMRG
jgi:tripartite ATP-independent transporter DctM subunit